MFEETREIVSQAAMRVLESCGLEGWRVDDDWRDGISEDPNSADRIQVRFRTPDGLVSIAFEMHDVLHRYKYVSPKGCEEEITRSLQSQGYCS